MVVNANIYVASAAVAGVLANRQRWSANLLRLPCISEEVDQLLMRLTTRQMHELALEHMK